MCNKTCYHIIVVHTVPQKPGSCDQTVPPLCSYLQSGARDYFVSCVHNVLYAADKGLRGRNVLQSVDNRYCYVIAHNQFAYIEERSNEPLRHYAWESVIHTSSTSLQIMKTQCSLYKLRYTPIHRGNLSQSQCNLSDRLIAVIANTWYLSHLPTHSHPHPAYTHVSAHRSHQSWAALVYQRGWTRPVPHTCRRWTKNSCSRKFFLWASRGGDKRMRTNTTTNAWGLWSCNDIN